MKEHEKAKLVNELTKAIKKLCPEAPAQLRQTISSIVTNRVPNKTITEPKSNE